MRVSQHYKLDKSQPELDFVDVDTIADTKLFVDPRAIRILDSAWGHECVSLIQSFFSAVLNAIREGRKSRAATLLSALREPNETRLGLSKGRARGRGMGRELASRVLSALSGSEAVETGLLHDLEDTILVVEGIDRDIISDIATNIIRRPLIEYTSWICSQESIPVQRVQSGPLWNPRVEQWDSPEYVNLPVAGGRRLLLVPKIIIRRTMEYEHDEYFSDYILPYLQDVETSAGSELVQLLKDGRTRVTKKDLIEKYGKGKRIAAEQTLAHPEILQRYREDKRGELLHPMGHDDLALAAGTEFPDWQNLLDSVLAISPGKVDADRYHRAVERLLTALFYPGLVMPKIEVPIHDGRKRIDITYMNSDKTGFFSWVSQHYPAAHVFVECKNYSADPGNPELDQLSGRFSPNRGRFGILVCRQLENRDLFYERCRDTANDDRGFILALDDSDLRLLTDYRVAGDNEGLRDHLTDLFTRVTH